MNEIDIKRDKIAGYIKGGGLIAVLVLTAFVFSILVAIVGAFTAGIAVIIISAVVSMMMAMAAINFLPVWAMICANRATKAKLNEATQNPIETVLNEIAEIQKEREAFKAVSAAMEAQISAMEEEGNNLRKTDPEGAAMYDEDNRLNRLELAERDELLKELTHNQMNLEELHTRMKGRWKMAQMHADYEKMRPKGKAQYMRKVLVDTAATSVMEAAAKSRANMRVNAVEAAARRAHIAEKTARFNASQQPAAPALSNNPTEFIIDTRTIEIKEKVQ